MADSEPKKTSHRTINKLGVPTNDMLVESLLNRLDRLDATEYTRTPEQKEMHMLWAMDSLRLIYSNGEYEKKLPDLLRRFNIQSILSSVAMIAPLNYGKAICTAMFLAAFLWTQHKTSVMMCFVSRRRCSMCKGTILRMLDHMTDKDETVIIKVSTEEKLTIVNALGEESTVHFWTFSDALPRMPKEMVDVNTNKILGIENAGFISEQGMQFAMDILTRGIPNLMAMATSEQARRPSATWESMITPKDARGGHTFHTKVHASGVLCYANGNGEDFNYLVPITDIHAQHS